MPIVQAHLIKGYPAETRRRLARALTDAVRFVIDAPADAVTVIMHEVDAESYMRGGAHRDPAPAPPDPAELVRAYLAAMEARDLDTARTMLADGFEMTFPGTGTMTTLEELVEWAAPRYRFVKKTCDAFEAFGADGRAIVYCHGTLGGEWPDGTPFSGIRFIDRFEVAGGKIVRQDVWNDLAEAGARA